MKYFSDSESGYELVELFHFNNSHTIDIESLRMLPSSAIAATETKLVSFASYLQILAERLKKL